MSKRDADNGFQDPLSFQPELRQHHFVALADRTGRQQRLLGGRPEPQHLRDRGGQLRRSELPAANLLGVGRGDASVARSGDGDRAFSAGSSSDPLTQHYPLTNSPPFPGGTNRERLREDFHSMLPGSRIS